MTTDLLIEDSPELLDRRNFLIQQSRDFSAQLWQRFARPLPTEEPFEWCIHNLVFADSEVKGPFEPTGRYYLRDIINDNNDDDMRYQTLIAGAGVSKTNASIGGLIWKIVHRPPRCLMIMPATKGEGGSETFATSRFIPALEATMATAAMIPRGQRRLYLNSKRVRLNGAHIGFVGGNSPTQVASNRCGDIRVDEADKTKGRLGDEAGLISLAKERFEGVEDYQFFLNTTPTVETRAGWKNLLQSDFRRRFLPCPHCNSEVRGSKSADRQPISELRTPNSVNRSPNSYLLTSLRGWFDLAWSEQYCVIPNKFLAGGAFPTGTAIPRATIVWDKEAELKDGAYDLARVFRSTRFQCPHCGGHIRDEHKLWMDEHGVWLPLQSGTPHHKGYHLPSLYSPPMPGNENSMLGGRALKFLNAHEDGEGMKGFINSTLAEVDVMQEHGTGGIEINSLPIAGPDWVSLLTADFHKNHPYIWFVVRKWCAFKLLPPFAFTDGRPEFVTALEFEENADAKKTVLQLAGQPLGVGLDTLDSGIWTVLAELMRFDSRTGRSPLVDFLIAQKIVGPALVKLYRETAVSDTMAFRKKIYELIAAHTGTTHRVPRGGDSELIAAGYCDLSGEACWEELADIIKEFQIGRGMPIPERCVAIDCGFAEKFNRAVLQKCYETATGWKFYDPLVKTKEPVFWQTARHSACQRAPVNGWQAIRGKPTFRPLGGGAIARDIGLHIEDPYYGTPTGGTVVVDVLEIPTDLFWMKTSDLRAKKTKQLYTHSPNCSWFPKRYLPDGTRTDESKFKREDYERQIHEQVYDETKNIVRPRHGKGGSQSRMHPYHLGDCETYQTALASHHEFFETAAPSGN